MGEFKMKPKIILLFAILFLFAINLQAQEGLKNTEMIRTNIMSAYDIFNSYNYDKLDAVIDEYYIEHSPDPGQKQGLEGLKEAFMELKKGFPDYRFRVDDIVIEGSKASVLFTFTGTNSGEMMGMKPTNKYVDIQGIDYLYLKDGKCTEHWGYIDMHKMMEQLGMNKKKDKM